MKKKLNKWQIGIKITGDYRRMESGWKVFDFWFLKLISLPPEGTMLTDKHYKGFRLLFRFWLPFENY